MNTFEGHRLRVRSSCGLAVIDLPKRAAHAYQTDAGLRDRLLAWARSAAVRLGCVEVKITARAETLASFEII